MVGPVKRTINNNPENLLDFTISVFINLNRCPNFDLNICVTKFVFLCLMTTYLT